MTEVDFITRRRPEGVEARPMGWWGMVLLVMVIATTYGALYFSYVYVRVATFEWPPAGIAPPPLGPPAWSAAALALSALPVAWAARGEAARQLTHHRIGLVAAVALAAAHFAILLGDWAAQPFGVDEHAYGSLYYVLPGIHASLLGIGVVMALVVFALSWHPETSLRHVGTRSLALYWYMVAAGGVLLLAVVYVTPHVWREAMVPG